eukprot:CAMPEP_0174236790 /NCGR_PEP_ID=MMETSP0417-20130205/5869_1 /TAXON_ID=242541 /ORGANISM="Mayorella sp, Strain BSH-02190019" /LENGTH=62 /DNA_ID=CAMNT_0015315483 /DNA_START=136 /DNA_END=324 /DNA_ORIENTATION=-
MPAKTDPTMIPAKLPELSESSSCSAAMMSAKSSPGWKKVADAASTKPLSEAPKLVALLEARP